MIEMKPEDVMRALELCKSCRDRLTCDGCPYFRAELGDDESCTNRMAQDALALLREKDARIVELQSIAEYQQSSNMKRWFELQEKDKQIAEKDAEIERLQNGLAISKKETKRYITSYKQTRAEAINEFAERMKKPITPLVNISTKERLDTLMLVLGFIDQIAEKMKGEENGESDL